MFYKDLLLVDDSEPFCMSIQEMLDENGWTSEYFTDPAEGLNTLKDKNFRVILLDLKMPNMSGLDFLRQMETQKLMGKNYVIVLTGEITIENAVDSLRLGAKDFIQKHVVVEYTDLFFERIEKGFEWQNERLRNEKLNEERKQAIQESQLIVKSIGHDMSGSYYASLMLRLQMLNKKVEKIKNETDNLYSIIPEASISESIKQELEENKKLISNLATDTIEKGKSIITLMDFFKELGKKLKELGSAIDLEKTHKEEVDLNNLLKTAIHLYMDSRVQENPEVIINEKYTETSLKMSASKEDLFRVFINIIENAYKSMDGKGTLSTVTNYENGYANLEISDSGCGISPENLEKIWRPDYTKWQGKQGTGLGLMICKKVIENHEGTIKAESKVGKGTTFKIKFKL